MKIRPTLKQIALGLKLVLALGIIAFNWDGPTEFADCRECVLNFAERMTIAAVEIALMWLVISLIVFIIKLIQKYRTKAS